MTTTPTPPRHFDRMRAALSATGVGVWLNPLPEQHWNYTPSIQMVQQVLGKRMFPLTIDGLERAMRSLSK